MTVQKKQAFGRILRHRLDAAKLFPNLGEKGKDFTELYPGGARDQIGACPSCRKNQIISCDKIISDRLSPSQIRFYYLSL